MTETELDLDAALAEMLECIQVRPKGDGFVGVAPAWFGEQLFGGFLIGQAVHAATRLPSGGRRIHSLHGYFVRPAFAGRPISYDVRPIREGRSFASRELVATQDGKVVFTGLCSFTADTEGYEYEMRPAADAPGPDSVEDEPGLGPFIRQRLGATTPDPDGVMRSTARTWFKIPRPLPDDPDLHAALVGFLTDVTSTGGRPLQLEGDVTGMISLDHAVWFHRPVRVDEWLYYDVHSLVNTAGRGLLRGTMHTSDRRLAVSVAQEMLLRPV